jgi:hypothetical protein
MKRLGAAILLLALAACAHRPAFQSVDAGRAAPIAVACRSCFLEGRWQLVHTIQAHLPGGRQTTLTGAVVLSTADRSVHCVLMTLEGVVLFDALDQDGHLTVSRALGPFANDHFAEGLVADIRFMFLAPDGGMAAAGHFGDGDAGCRYPAAGDRTLDLIVRPGGWQLRQYDPSGRLRRTLTADGAEAGAPAPHMTLEAAGSPGYRLSMTLVDAVPLS